MSILSNFSYAYSYLTLYVYMIDVKSTPMNRINQGKKHLLLFVSPCIEILVKTTYIAKSLDYLIVFHANASMCIKDIRY